MNISEREFAAVERDSLAVLREAKEAGGYVFGGGIDESAPPVLVSADGRVAEGGYPWATPCCGSAISTGCDYAEFLVGDAMGAPGRS